MTFIIDHWQFDHTLPRQIEGVPDCLTPDHWYHCHRESDALRQWLVDNAVPSSIVDSLLAEDTRPLFEQYDDQNFLLILRGVNLNHQADPSDMLSVRILYYNGALITTRKITSRAIQEIRNDLHNPLGPKTLGDLVVRIIDGLNRYIDDYLDSMEEKIIAFDDANELSDELMRTHKAMLKVKRFIKPQQYAIADYQESGIPLAQHKHLRLRHSVNTITRINETLDFYLSELELIKSELRMLNAEKMNQNTYLFSIIAAIFLPASFITGLLGVNVGGIPGTGSPAAFVILCIALLLVLTLELWILKRLGFFGNNKPSETSQTPS